MMNFPFKAKVLPAVLSGLMVTAVAWADDMPETDAADTEVVEVASTVPNDNISGYFSDFLGGDTESQSLVEGLHDGSIHYVEPVEEGGDTSAETTEAPETAETEDTGTQGMGYGNVFITLALAEQLASASAAEAVDGETGMTADESVNEILRMREVDGMGWGQVAKELGLNLGEVISGIRSNRPEKVTMHKMDKTAGREKAEMMKVEKMARMERPERPTKVERPEKPERPAKPERPERPSR